MSLYNPNDSRDNCGFGLIAHTHGEASHELVTTAIHGLDRMQHRGGIAADGKTGDGCGLLLQKPDAFFHAIAEENGWKLSKKYGVNISFIEFMKTGMIISFISLTLASLYLMGYLWIVL